MSSITPRVPLIDWSKGFDRHWCGDSAAMTHWYNAMSFLFPLGEKFFRDSVLEVSRTLDLSSQPELQREVRDFAVQESLHSAQHEHYNAVLKVQGFDNVAEPSLQWWLAFAQRYLSPLSRLAVVCTYEHYTAVLAENLLSAPKRWMLKAPDMALFWGWHAAEETEHKAVAFDVYQAAGGGWLRRVFWFFMASIGLNVLFFGRQFLYMMRKDAAMRVQKVASATVGSKHARRAFLGPVGFDVRAALSFIKPSFHPWQRDNREQMRAWLDANAARLRVVGDKMPSS